MNHTVHKIEYNAAVVDIERKFQVHGRNNNNDGHMTHSPTARC
jgi:hypothetical protein